MLKHLKITRIRWSSYLAPLSSCSWLRPPSSRSGLNICSARWSASNIMTRGRHRLIEDIYKVIICDYIRLTDVKV